jgi:hypothetical protein
LHVVQRRSRLEKLLARANKTRPQGVIPRLQAELFFRRRGNAWKIASDGEEVVGDGRRVASDESFVAGNGACIAGVSSTVAGNARSVAGDSAPVARNLLAVADVRGR